MDQIVMLTRRVYRLEQELAALKGSPLEEMDEVLGQEAPAPAVRAARAAPGETYTPAPRPQTDVAALETVVAATWFARIGAIALVIGAAFAFKYGVDRGYIGPGVRVLSGVVVGFALILAAEWAKKRSWDVFAQAIAAAGAGLLYLSTWASYHLYGFINAGTTFPLLIIVTLLMAGLAVRHNSTALAVLATVGGFVDPLLVGGAQHPLALYGYILVLDVGVVGLATSRRWVAPPFVALAGSWLIYASGVDHASDATAFWYATAFFLIFAAPAYVRRAERREQDTAGAVIFLASALAYLAAGFSVLGRHTESMQFPFVVGLGAFCVLVGAYAWLDRRNPDAGVATFLFGLTCFVIAVPLQWNGDAIPIALAVLAVVYAWVGFRMRINAAAWGGVVILAYTILATVFGLYQVGTEYKPDHLVFSAQSGTMVVLIAAAYLVAAIVRGERDERYRVPWMGSVAVANALTVIWMSFEAYARQRGLTGYQPSSAFPFTLTAIWALYAGALLVVGFVSRSRGVRLMGLALFGITIVKMALVDLWTVQTGYRVLGFLGIGVLLLIASLTYHRFRWLVAPDETPAET